jgi:hypothetical protein
MQKCCQQEQRSVLLPSLSVIASANDVDRLQQQSLYGIQTPSLCPTCSDDGIAISQLLSCSF